MLTPYVSTGTRNADTIFGRVSEGMGVVQRMSLVATDAEDR